MKYTKKFILALISYNKYRSLEDSYINYDSCIMESSEAIENDATDLYFFM